MTPLTPADGASVAAVWAATFGHAHPLGPDAWRAWWTSPDAEADLWLDLPARPTPATPAGVRFLIDPAAALEFTRRAFPGRWADEVAAATRAGAAALVAERAGEAVGFCLLADPRDPLPGAPLRWTARRPWGPLDAGIGGMGPLGLVPSARGSGLGLALVAAAAAALHERGHRAAVIDWTTLTGFYGRLGARAWRVYQRAEGTL